MERIKDLFLHPTFLAKYAKDSFGKIIGLLILAIFAINSVVFLDYAKSSDMHYSTYLSEISALQNYNNLEMTMVDGELSGGSFSFSDGLINFAVNEDVLATSNSQITIHFASDHYEVITLGVILEEVSYEKNPLYNFTLSEAINYNTDSLNGLYAFLNAAYSKVSRTLIPVYYVSNVLLDILTVFIVFIFLSLFLRSANRAIPSSIRYKLCLLSLNIYVLFIFLGYLFANENFRLFGFFLSYFYAWRSLRSIISVKVNKNKEQNKDE